MAALSARIVLPTTTMEAGSSIAGEVVVENDTGRALHATGCLSVFAVVLGNDDVKPTVAWPECLQSFTVPTGESTYRVTVVARFRSCPPPPCRAHGQPAPLPPGRYRAMLFRSTPVVPSAPPVAMLVSP
jgi:hypothetical protein